MKRTLTTRTLCLLLAAAHGGGAAARLSADAGGGVRREPAGRALEEAVLATPAPPAQYEAPERWTESFDVRGQTVRIDVAVECRTRWSIPC